MTLEQFDFSNWKLSIPAPFFEREKGFNSLACVAQSDIHWLQKKIWSSSSNEVSNRSLLTQENQVLLQTPMAISARELKEQMAAMIWNLGLQTTMIQKILFQESLLDTLLSRVSCKEHRRSCCLEEPRWDQNPRRAMKDKSCLWLPLLLLGPQQKDRNQDHSNISRC